MKPDSNREDPVKPLEPIELDSKQIQEVKFLKWTAGIVLTWLIALVLDCVSFGAALLAGLISLTDPIRGIVVCLVGGTLGSSVSALVSAADRVSKGWELSAGVKYPQEKPKDKFVARMAPFFVVRPFLGLAAGFVFYAGLTGGYLIATKETDSSSFSQNGLMVLSFLVGLMTKTFLERLRDMFDALFGKKSEADSTKASNSA